MVDIAIKDQLKTYWNGALAGAPNAVYDEIVNFDVVKNPYKIRKDQSSFFLRKRKGFKQAFALGFGGECVDIQDLWDSDCEGGTGWRYYYMVNGSTHRIYKREIGSCAAPTQVDSRTACDCQYQGFLKTEFVKGPKRRAYAATATNDVGNGVIVNDSGDYVNGGIYDVGDDWNYQGATNGIQNGDFFWFNRNGGGDDSIPGQVKRIVGYDATGYSGESTLKTSSAWALVSGPTDGNVGGAFFPEWGDVLLYVGKDQGYMGATDLPVVKIIHSPYTINPSTGVQTDDDTITMIGSTIPGTGSRCVSGMTENAGNVLFHYSNGYTVFGTGEYGKFYHSLESQFFFGKEIRTIASYRNFVLGFSKGKISVATFDGTDYQRYYLRDNLGIVSYKAYALFDNSFYFVGSDKRLYAVDLKSDGGNYLLELSDQSGPMLGHLNNIRDGDEITMGMDREELKIYHFLASNDSPNIATKILTYNKDYGFFHWRETRLKIIGVNEDEYFGSAVFFNCGDQDGLEYFTAKVNAYIGDNTQNGTEISIFQKSSLNWGKLLLGNGIYNNGFTYINVYCWRNGWRTIQRLGRIEDIERTQKYGEYVTEGDVADDNCLSPTTSSGGENIYSGPVGGEEYEEVEDPRCGSIAAYSCPDYIDENVEGKIITSELDKVAEVGVLHIPIKNNPSDLIKIEIVSKGLDVLNFGGMLREVQKYPIDDKNSIGDFILKDENCNLAYQ